MSLSLNPGANLPKEFTGVKVLTKANLYFDGRVASHTLIFPDGSKKTLGLIYPGTFHFNTEAAERMEIVSGACRVLLDNEKTTHDYPVGSVFDVPGRSGFQIEVADGVCEYICSFLK